MTVLSMFYPSLITPPPYIHLKTQRGLFMEVTLPTTHLGTQRGLFMEVTPHKVTVLPCTDATLAVYTDTTRVPYNLAGHVLCSVELAHGLNRSPFTADWPAGDVIWPLMGRH